MTSHITKEITMVLFHNPQLSLTFLWIQHAPKIFIDKSHFLCDFECKNAEIRSHEEFQDARQPSDGGYSCPQWRSDGWNGSARAVAGDGRSSLEPRRRAEEGVGSFHEDLHEQLRRGEGCHEAGGGSREHLRAFRATATDDGELQISLSFSGTVLSLAPLSLRWFLNRTRVSYVRGTDPSYVKIHFHSF